MSAGGRLLRLMARVRAEVPPDVQGLRSIVTVGMLFHSLATLARLLPPGA